jgi:hypothetical protein
MPAARLRGGGTCKQRGELYPVGVEASENIKPLHSCSGASEVRHYIYIFMEKRR